MYITRTDAIEKMIEEKYNASKKVSSSYREVGKENYYFSFWPVWTWTPNCTSYAIDTVKLLQNLQGSSNILEIGCGGGQFLKAQHGEDRQVYGVSIEDECLRDTFLIDNLGLKTIPFERHINHHFGNAENIDTLEPINKRKYRFIFSQFSFIHFLDPLGALQKAYALLEDNGILMVDILLLNGFTDPMPLLWHLHKKGYEFITSTGEVAPSRVGTTNDYSTLSCFFIRKTRPTLDLPLNLLLIEDSKAIERVGYSWNEKLIDSQIDYQDQNFLLKISDNEWVQALAIQRILHLDPQLITNNPKFSAEIGKIILEEQAEKIAIPKYFDRNEKNLFLNHNIRAGFTPFEIDNAKKMCQCTTFETHNNYDAYGFKPIHLAVRLDNLQLFEYLIDLYPQMLEEKTLNQLAMTPFELATYYHMHTKGNKIYDFLQKYNTELLQQPNAPKNSGSSIGPFFPKTEAGSEARKSEDVDQKIKFNMTSR